MKLFAKKKKNDKSEEKPERFKFIPANEEELEHEAALKKKQKMKMLIIISAVTLLVIVVIIFSILISLNRNDGERIALALSDKLGSTSQKAAKNADITLEEESEYDFINNIGDFKYIYESEKTIEIDGVNIPQWVILCYEDDKGQLDEVVYYDYKILKKNSLGTKLPEKIDIQSIEDGMTISKAEEILCLDPIKVVNDKDNTSTYTYKYCYNDSDSKNLKSYYITVMYNFDDKVMGIKEEENSFISDIVSLN